jgi:YVTN family beta-propeller protein
MNKSPLALIIYMSGTLFVSTLSAPVLANEKVSTPVAVQKTFDGSIQNNSLAISPDEKLAVVSYSARTDIAVYDLEKGELRQVINGFITPRNIVFAPDGNSFYVSDSSKGTVECIDSASLNVTHTFSTGPGSFGTALSKDGKTLWINNQAGNNVTRLNTDSGLAETVITGFSQPRQGVKLSPDGRTLYVTNFLGDKITAVDTSTNKITGEIKGFSKIRAISVSQDGKTLYAANSGSDTIAVVDLPKQKIMRTVEVGKNPYGAALSPDGKFIYSGNLTGNSLSVIDVASLNVTTTIKGFNEPRQALVFTKDGNSLWVLNKDLSLSKVDRKEQKVVATIKE